MPVARKVRAAAFDEATKHGLTAKIGQGGKHPKLIVTNGVKRRTTTLSGTPRSDADNQMDWVRQQVRRMAKSMPI